MIMCSLQSIKGGMAKLSQKCHNDCMLPQVMSKFIREM